MTDQSSADLVTITIDGVVVKTPRNTMLIEAADKLGVNIPRFCYHKHLSVAANCRMCMVEVEKVPKPLPACATPVNEGMVVHTHSKLALDAQKCTMEFLLINHPLDCPVCDQGGECELQDVAMGYGSDVSRYNERKRVVRDKNIGPLVSTDMTRCIHCTRCVRFGNEIAGISELGVTGRGEFVEIGTYVEKSLSSELSGNVIDLCPVGALNAKPSRMKARAWEMTAQPSISVHDSFGSNLIMHTLRNKVIRVVPNENPEINETWISDRDRFSYEGMYSENRVSRVTKKENGEWENVDWSDAIQNVAATLKKYQPDDVGILVSPNQSNEELFLLQKIARKLNIKNIDHRINREDFTHQEADPVFPWLGQSITEIESRDVIVIIGSDMRCEQPMLTHKIRKASARGAKVFVLNPQHCEFHIKLTKHVIVKPQHWLPVLLQLLGQLSDISGVQLPGELHALLDDKNNDDNLASIIQALMESTNATILIGNLMQQHYAYSSLRAVTYWIAQLSKAIFGYVSMASNCAGASLLGVLPHRLTMSEVANEPGMDYAQMVQSPRKVYLIMGFEPEWDCLLPVKTVAALKQAEVVISINSFMTEMMHEYCDWVLPLNCYAEAEGTKINMEGRWQNYSAVVESADDSKHGWKILRMLGAALQLDGFEYMDINDVRQEISGKIDQTQTLSNTLVSLPQISVETTDEDAIFSLGATPIYTVDSLVRNAHSLRQAQALDESVVMVHPFDIEKFGLIAGKWVKVSQDNNSSILQCVMNTNILPGTVYIPRGLPRSEKLDGVNMQVQLKNLSVA